MRWSFPPIETISPYLMGNMEFDLRDPQIREQVRNLIFYDDEFLFRTLLGLDDSLFSYDIHSSWLRLAEESRKTMLLAPRDSLKCLHPLTLVPSKFGSHYLKNLPEQFQISSVFNSQESNVNVKGTSNTNFIIRVVADEPFNFWVYASKEHEFFCFDMTLSEFVVVKAEDLNISKHFPLISKPPNFKPFIKATDSVLNLIASSTLNEFNDKGEVDSRIFNLSTESFVKLLPKLKFELIKDVDPFTLNTIQVLKFYHGLIKGFPNILPAIKEKLMFKDKRSLSAGEIAFLLDADTDFKPTPLQTSEGTYFTKLKSVDHISIKPEKLQFIDINTTNKHYIANGFVTHNSTVRTVGGILRRALKDPEKRYAIISATGKLASGYVRKIKRICEFNPIIRYCFNDVISPADIVKWSGEALEFKRKSIFPEPTIWSLGVGTDFTGFHFDVAYFEDLVTIKHRQSVALRKSTWDWFKLTAIPALDRKKGEGHITGTRYHWDDMYTKITEIAETSGDWKILRQPACDEDLLTQDIYKSFWPERFPEDELRAIREDYGEETFQLQYQVAGGLVLGQKEYVQKLRDSIIPIESAAKTVDHVLGVDLASKGLADSRVPKHRKSNFSTTVIGRHEETGKFVVCSVKSIKRPSLNDQREYVYSEYTTYNCLIAGIEFNAYQNVFKEYLEEGSTPIGIKPIKSFNSKDARHDFIIDLIKSEGLFFLEGMCQPLIDELFTYPENTADSIDSCFFALKVSMRDMNLRFV